MILASHGIVASQIASFDADAVAFFGRVTTAGGSLSATEKAAVNQLVLDLKANSLWTPMKAIYPMVGASAAACAQNLKSSSFTGTFTSGWTFASTGVTGNGTSAYMDTALNPNNNLTFNSVHLCFYSRTDTLTGSKTEIGAINDTVDYLPLSTLEIKRDTGTFNSCQYSYQAGQILSTINTDAKGFYLNTRISSTQFKTFKNNTNIATTTNANSQTVAPNQNYFLGATNSAGTAAEFSDRQCAFASIGDGLTDTQASNFYTAVQAFQTTLSRQV